MRLVDAILLIKLIHIYSKVLNCILYDLVFFAIGILYKRKSKVVFDQSQKRFSKFVDKIQKPKPFDEPRNSNCKRNTFGHQFNVSICISGKLLTKFNLINY